MLDNASGNGADAPAQNDKQAESSAADVAAQRGNGDQPSSADRDEGSRLKVKGEEKAADAEFSAVARRMGLPEDVAAQIKGASAPQGDSAAEGGVKKEELRSSDSSTADAATRTEADAELDPEPEAEHRDDPFKDGRVQERLGKEKKKRERFLRASGASEEDIAEINASRDPVAAGEAFIAERLNGSVRKSAETADATAPVAGPAAPASKGLLGSVVNEQQLDAYEQWADTTLTWCDANPEGVAVTDPRTGAEKFHSAQDIAEFRRKAERVMLHAPKRRQEIRDALGAQMSELQRFNAVAAQRYPALFDKEAPEHGEIMDTIEGDDVLRGFLQRNPNAAYDPAINLLLGGYVNGVRAKQPQPRAGDLNPDLPESLTRRHPPIASHTPPNPPTRSGVPNGSKRIAEAMDHAYQTGDRESVAEALKALRKEETSQQRSNGRAPALV